MHKHTIPLILQSRHTVQWHHGIIVKSDVQVVSVQCTLSGGWSPGLLVSALGFGTSPLLLLARRGEYICLIFASIMSGSEEHCHYLL